MTQDTLSVAQWRAEQAAAMLERGRYGLQEQVRQLALAYGWRFFHTWNSRHSPAGYPDCHMLRGNRQIVAELKREGEELKPEQVEWLEAFAEAGAETYFWRPSDLIEHRIHRILE